MSKIALIGDMHFSIRAGSPIFMDNMNLFLRKCLLPYLKDNNIKTILQTGDLYDNRKRNDNLSVHNSMVEFFDPLQAMGIEFHTIVGNHCMFKSDVTYPNASELYLSEVYENVHVYNSPETIQVDGLNIDMICWMCDSNTEPIMKFMKASKSKVCVAHPEINGFKMAGNFLCEHGIGKDVFSNYKLVIAGHFHDHSIQDNINYIGSPTQHNYGECDVPKGFWVFDTNTFDMEFIENPYKLFIKLDYNDDYNPRQIPDCENKFVLVNVPSEYDHIKYKHYLEEVWSHSPHEVKAIHAQNILIDDDGEEIIEEVDIANLVIDVVPFLAKYSKKISPDCEEKTLSEMYKGYYDKTMESM